METEFKRFAILLKIYSKFSSYLFNTLHRLLVQRNCTVKGKQTELLTAIGWKVNRKLIEANLVPSTAGKHSDYNSMSVWLCDMSFTWICFLLLELCSVIPEIAWSQGWLFKYVLWQNVNWEIDSFKKKKKARLTENKTTVSSLSCFQCLLQATDGGFSISWWK